MSISNLNQGGFCQLPQNDRTYRSIFTLPAKFFLQESRLSDQFLKGRKLLGTFLSKVRKFYIITFSTFLSQHFDQAREGFFFQNKQGSERELNLRHRAYLPWYKPAVTKLVPCGNATLALNIFIC